MNMKPVFAEVFFLTGFSILFLWWIIFLETKSARFTLASVVAAGALIIIGSMMFTP